MLCKARPRRASVIWRGLVRAYAKKVGEGKVQTNKVQATRRPKGKGKSPTKVATKIATNVTTTKVPSTTQNDQLPPLPAQPLRDLALLCGRNASGTKAVLRDELHAAIQEVKPKPKSVSSILSIDMGVRNLAYCLLRVDGTAVRLAAWERLTLVDDDKKGDASQFAPPAMAVVAAQVLRDRLLPLQPTSILIERQRFRSGGAAAVLEWTVRVNSLEAMLHGILAWVGWERGSQQVLDIHAVSPRRVAQFVLRGGGGPDFVVPVPTERVAKEKDIKDVKEAFAAYALQRGRGGQGRKGGGGLVSWDAKDKHLEGMVKAYLARWEAKRTKKRTTKTTKTEKTPTLAKIDDLADCLTQGLVWLAWERNKKALAQDGAEALLEDQPLPKK